MPKGLSPKERKLYKAFAIKPAGEWSRDLLENTEGGKLLAVGHFVHVKKVLAKAKPKNKKELEKVVKEAMMSPQQRLVILYEKGLRMPLSDKEFREYLELFKECFPNAYKSLYGKKSPREVIAEASGPPLIRRKS
ncbi:MAG: hypothetical protein QXK12_09000 [Candidatus Nezhaarchaeales archaeon]